MLWSMETKEGFISIEKPVLAKIVREVVSSYDEIVEIVSSKGQVTGLFNKLTFDRDSSYIEIKKEKKEEKEAIGIYFQVIMKFGSKTGMVTKKIIEEIRTKVKEYTEIDVEKVSIHIVGMKSKNVVSRNIIIKG